MQNCFEFMENEKYYTERENNNLQNISAIQNCILTLTTSFSKQWIKEMQRIQKAFI